MSTEVYVMPLWQYRSGQFESPMARFAREAGVPHSVIRLRPMPLLRRFLAKRYVRKLQRTLCRATGLPSAWKDEGIVHYSHQFRGGWVLKDFACWLDIQDLVPEYRSEAIVEARKTHRDRLLHATRSFPLIGAYDYTSGYLVPMDFPDSVKVSEEIWGETYTRVIVSAQALLREVERLNEHLQVPESWDHKSWPEHRFQPMASLFQLREILRLSVSHSLPVMFDG